MKNRIPQMAPKYGEEEIKALAEYIRSDGWGAEFVKTKHFEDGFAEFTDCKYAIASINGTITLSLGMMALGLKPGDELS